MASQNHAAKTAIGSELLKWNRSMWSKVTTRVVMVKTRTVGTAIRARSHHLSREAKTSKAQLAQYSAPKKAAVMGG